MTTEEQAAYDELASEVRRLRNALMRIAFRDRHYRLVKPKSDGGYRGVGGMIATFALTGVNGSYIGDTAIAEMYPDIAAELQSQPNPQLSTSPEAVAPALET